MIKIEINPLDQKDLLEILDFMKKHYESEPENNKWNNKNWWLLRIEQLKIILKGENGHESFVKSSYETIEKSMNEKERHQYWYQKNRKVDNGIIKSIQYGEDDE